MVCPFVFTTLQSDPRDLRPLRHLIREMRWHLWDICDKDNDIGQWHLTPITQWHLLKQSWLKVTPDNRQHSQLLQKSALFTVHERTCSRFTRLFVRCLSPCPKYLINPYNAIFLKSQGSKDIKNDILDCQIHKYTNTNSQIHKYSLWWSAGNTQHVLYFWKAKGPRTSNMIFWTVKYTYTQIQMHKYTNTNSQKHQTQIQHMTKWQKYPTYAIFLNSWWFKDVKNDILKCPKCYQIRSEIWDLKLHLLTSDFCIVPPGPQVYLEL